MPRTLDVNEKQKVQYAVPLWLRDEQIAVNMARTKERLQACADRPSERIAVVCFGPSLTDTWEKIREFQYIITCSGAHRFLIDRGIVPTWHLDVDPRKHKLDILGPPHADVEYLIASTCHPSYIDRLASGGFKLKLWHIVDTKDEAHRVIPRGEWALTGGGSAGLRCLTMARFLGFMDLHVFGMDGSEGKTGKHAAYHPMSPKKSHPCEYDGVTYHTTPAILECARATFHELDAMPDTNVTFYGDGLVQAMHKKYVRKPIKGDALIGHYKPDLISAQFRDMNVKLHKENLTYGVGGGKHAPDILKIIKKINARSVLDYGCGKGYLGKALAQEGIPIWEYDPAISGKETSPFPADIVVCTDVLEHVEKEFLPYVLDDIRRCTKQVAYFVIHTGPAKKCYADGRNTHLIQKGEGWWKKTLGEYFVFAGNSITKQGPHLRFIVGRKNA